MRNYTTQWSSATPGYLIFLIDQSASMQKSFEYGKTRAEATADAINNIIRELILTNTSGDKIKNRIFITLIGYDGGLNSNSVEEIRSDYLSEFDEAPLGYDADEEPYFIEPIAKGVTPMADAFSIAKELIEEWRTKKPQAPAPIIMNISDGNPYTEESRDDVRETIEVAQQIMNISTNDGNPLIFNIYIGEGGSTPIEFAQDESQLQGDEQGTFLFKISSIVPDVLQEIGRNKYLFDLHKISRGFSYKADSEKLIKFIEFGSSSR